MSSKTFTGSIRVQTTFALSRASLNNIQQLDGPASDTKSISYTTGSGVSTGVANEGFYQKRYISTGGFDVLDLVGGGLVDLINETNNLVRVKAIVIKLLSAADDSVDGNTCSGILIRPHSASPYKMFMNTTCSENLSGVKIDAGSFLAWGTPSAAGVPTSASFGDQIYVGNLDSGVTASYIWGIIGADA